MNTPQKSGFSTPSKPSNRGDRFIARRAHFDADLAHFQLTGDENQFRNDCSASSPKVDEYKRQLASALLDQPEGGKKASKILHFKEVAPEPKASHNNSNLKVLYTQNKTKDASAAPRKFARHIPTQPHKILDAPEFVDDYYLNLLSWGSNNCLAVALANSLYLWNATSGDIQCLFETNDAENNITALSWVKDGNYLAIGLNNSEVQLWDTERAKLVRTMKGHLARVSALDWNGHILSSGSRDTNIINHDVRIAQHVVSTLEGHTQEICGLKWSPDGTQLASGANDNLVKIWSPNFENQFTLDQHQAAVKALAWCPFQRNLLATGGGSADRTIRFWNTTNGVCLNSIDTYSQVCALEWSKHEKEIVSAHRFSQNQISVWKYPSMVKLADLTGHTSRVLAMAQSPDGETIVSASGDETLRFWKCLGSNEIRSSSGASASSGKVDKSVLSSVNLR